MSKEKIPDGNEVKLSSELLEKAKQQSGTVKVIRDHTPKYLFYHDGRKNLRWVFQDDNEAVKSDEMQKVIIELRDLVATPVQYLHREHAESWENMLGHAISLIADGKVDFSREMLSKASIFLQKRSKEKARVWMVEASVITSFFVIVSCLLGFGFIFAKDISTALMFAAVGFGVMGSQFSILTRLGGIVIDPASGRRVYWKDSIIRIISGMFAGLITYIAIKSELIFGFIEVNSDFGLNKEVDLCSIGVDIHKVLENKYFWIVALMTTLAGFSERFVPSFLEKIEDASAEHVGDTIRPKHAPIVTLNPESVSESVADLPTAK
ncbi:MAG: hypothetical protein RI964_521 [Pseudomonadota bacterium]